MERSPIFFIISEPSLIQLFFLARFSYKFWSPYDNEGSSLELEIDTEFICQRSALNDKTQNVKKRFHLVSEVLSSMKKFPFLLTISNFFSTRELIVRCHDFVVFPRKCTYLHCRRRICKIEFHWFFSNKKLMFSLTFFLWPKTKCKKRGKLQTEIGKEVHALVSFAWRNHATIAIKNLSKR